ncbi:MAG: hypothetical protein K6T16_00820 [Candidatus Pacearchaeota archaeon]|nr:hypothetical protein [Candidatus Pacearchaeota archaeon]
MVLKSLLIPFLFQVGPTIEEARAEIIKYCDRFFTQMIRSVETKDMKSLLKFNEDFDTTAFKEIILGGEKQNKKQAILASLKEQKDEALTAIKNADIKKGKGCSVILSYQWDGCKVEEEYSFSLPGKSTWVLSEIKTGERTIYVGDYLTKEEREKVNKEFDELAKSYSPEKFDDGIDGKINRGEIVLEKPREEAREEQVASPLEFSVEEEYTRIVYAKELWEVENLPISETLEKELEGKYHKVWVLKIKVRGTSAKEEYVSFEVLPLVDSRGNTYYPISRYDDSFWKIFNGDAEMDYTVTERTPITRQVPFLYWSNADPCWQKHLIPRNTIFKIGDSNTEVRSP